MNLLKKCSESNRPAACVGRPVLMFVVPVTVACMIFENNMILLPTKAGAYDTSVRYVDRTA